MQLTIPFMTFPNTTCFPSSHGVALVVIKNCDRFVSFPEFAIDSHPAPTCFNMKFSSSNLEPYMLSPRNDSLIYRDVTQNSKIKYLSFVNQFAAANINYESLTKFPNNRRKNANYFIPEPLKRRRRSKLIRRSVNM